MSKKYYTLITPANPEHSIAEAGLRVHRLVMDQDQLNDWLRAWDKSCAEFYIETNKEVRPMPDKFLLKVFNEDAEPSLFTMDKEQLNSWLTEWFQAEKDKALSYEIKRLAA